MNESDHLLERVLISVDGARNTKLTVSLLERAGVASFVCENTAQLAAELERGAAAALVAEEMLTTSAVRELRAVLECQAAWSDFPIMIFGVGDTPSFELRARELGNVTFLDRPVRARSMIASVRAAIRSRRRQYEARHAIESRDTFLAMLGHELRNPLGAIRLAVNALEKHDATATMKAHAIIDRQSKHLARLVDDLLDVARITHGKVKLARTRLDLVDVVRKAYESVEPRAGAARLAYRLVTDSGPLWVDGDRQRLEQVFANLLTNAVKYTPAGGSVTVTVRADGKDAVVDVADTGVGIAPELIDRVFDVFAQAERSLDRTDGGMGLGLAVVRSLVALHGGTVTAASEGAGRGSSFLFRMPMTESTIEARPSTESLRESLARKRVVVVEDSEDIRDLMIELLRDEGHDVTAAESGPQGLQAILEVAPDIAFVDLGLPGFDGLEVARRARVAGVSTRLVAVTGYGQAEDRARALAAGFDDHLTKPVGDVDLYRALARLDES